MLKEFDMEFLKRLAEQYLKAKKKEKSKILFVPKAYLCIQRYYSKKIQ